MNDTTRVLRATRLFAHLDDLCQLKQVEKQDLPILCAGLSELIRALHTPVLPEPGMLPVIFPERVYTFEERSWALNRLRVQVEGRPDRFLPSVSIFAWEMTLSGYATYDTALAILADFFGETLSRRAFARGTLHACRDYAAVAAFLPAKLRHGVLTSTELAAFLQEQGSSPFLSNKRSQQKAFPPIPLKAAKRRKYVSLTPKKRRNDRFGRNYNGRCAGDGGRMGQTWHYRSPRRVDRAGRIASANPRRNDHLLSSTSEKRPSVLPASVAIHACEASVQAEQETISNGANGSLHPCAAWRYPPSPFRRSSGDRDLVSSLRGLYPERISYL